MKLAIPPSGHSLGAGLRELLDAGGSVCRIELAPQSPFAGDPEFRSSSLAAWTIANSGKADVLDANTTVPDHLAIHQAAGQSSVWFGNGRDGPYAHQNPFPTFPSRRLWTIHRSNAAARLQWLCESLARDIAAGT